MHMRIAVDVLELRVTNLNSSSGTCTASLQAELGQLHNLGLELLFGASHMHNCIRWSLQELGSILARPW